MLSAQKGKKRAALKAVCSFWLSGCAFTAAGTRQEMHMGPTQVGLLK